MGIWKGGEYKREERKMRMGVGRGGEGKRGTKISITYFFQLNTFQSVLATDGLHSFILFLYPTGGIQWTAGDTHGRNGHCELIQAVKMCDSEVKGARYETMVGGSFASPPIL